MFPTILNKNLSIDFQNLSVSPNCHCFISKYILTHKKIPSKKDHPKNSIRTPNKICVFFSENPKRTSHPLIHPSADSFPPWTPTSDERPWRRKGDSELVRHGAVCRTAATGGAQGGDRLGWPKSWGVGFGGWVFVGLERTPLWIKRVGLKMRGIIFSCWVFLCVCVFVLLFYFGFSVGGVVVIYGWFQKMVPEKSLWRFQV